MNTKLKKSVIMIYAILLAAHTLLFFVIPFTRSAAVWISFIFSEISIVLGYFITNYSYDNRESVKTMVYGFPVLYISYTYTAVQLVISGIIFIVNKFISTPVWISAVTGIFLLAFTLISAVLADNARDIIEDIDKKNEK